MATRLVNTDELKKEIRESLTISDIASELVGVELQQAGHQYKSLCPLHDEDTPSFTLNDSKGLYHCFGCKAGGDDIDLMRRVYNLEYFEALYKLAAEAGIDIAKYERPLTEEERIADNTRERAEEWIYSLPLAKDRQSQMAQVFGVKQGDGDLHLPGISDYHTRGVIFPLRSPAGKLVGWRARTQDKKFFATPKDFAIHEPTLFGIDIARDAIRESGEVVIVEGEYDAMALHGVGIKNAVSIGGSRFTDEQMVILERLRIRKATFLFDGDTAGRDASLAVAKRYWQHDVRVHIAEMPDGMDPDDLAESGSILLENVIQTAKWSLEYCLWQEWLNRSDSMSDKLSYIDWVAAEYGADLTAAEEMVVAQYVADWVGLPEAQVLDLAKVTKGQLHSVESEQVILGRSLREIKYYQQLRKSIVMMDFYLVRHQRVWSVLEELLVENLDFDIDIIKKRAKNTGVEPEYVNLLVESGGSNIKYHEREVADLSIRRTAKEEADRFRERISDTSIEAKTSIGNLTLGVTRKALSDGPQFKTIADQVDEAMETLHERMRNPNAVHGIDLGTQFPLLNQKLQGIQKRRLVLVGALSGVGKTTITIQWALNMAVNQSIPTDYISLEMDAEELLFKSVSHLTGVPAEAITAGSLTPDEAKKVERGMMRIKKSPLKLYAPDDITASEFVMYARESVMDRRTEVFFLDYVQMASPDADMVRKPTYEQLKEFGRIAKTQVARGMDTCVICPAQLSKMSGEKERPTKEDMGDSYDLSRTADVVIILKGNEDSDMIDLWLDKNRQGSGGHLIPTLFTKAIQTFHEQGGHTVPDYLIS